VILGVLPGARPADGGRPTARLGDLPEPGFSSREVLVEVRATALNRADLLQLRGLYPPPPGETEIPGLECAGVVREVGAEVEGWSPGDRVMALLAGGGHAERVAVPAGQLMELPGDLSFEEGAALPEACLTAWTNLVVEGGLSPEPEGNAERSVLITGATGGMGTMAVQVARQLGARVLAAGRSPDRLEPLRALGADVLVVAGEGLADRVREETGGRGVDLVFDLVSGEHLDRHLSALRDRGRLVLVGLMAGPRTRVDLAQVLRRRLTIVGSVLRARSRDEKARLVSGFAAFAGERLADGRIRPVIDRVLPFAEIADAYRALEAGGVAGKVVLRMRG
jgi:putative PIG3 family NAD(P)H quinone oxidoreductase